MPGFARFLAAIACATVAYGAQVPLQQFPVGNAVIDGVVTAAATKRPVGGAVVTVTGDVLVNGRSVALSRTTRADSGGHFSFTRLPPGRFVVSGRRDPFLVTRYGQTRPAGSGTPIVITDDQHRTIALELVQGANVTGQVSDEQAIPLVGVRVVASRWGYVNGVRRLTRSSATDTNDDGSYKIAGLIPGEWVISVFPPGDAASLARMADIEAVIQAAPRRPSVQMITMPTVGVAGYLPTYYPGVGDRASAATITLVPGESRSGVDVQAGFPRAAIIRGTVAVPPGRDFSVFVGVESNDAGGSFRGAVVDANGAFSLPNLPPGRYTIGAEVAPSSTQESLNRQGGIPAEDTTFRLWGSAEVQLDGAEAVTAIAVRPAGSVSGQMTSDTVLMDWPTVSLQTSPGSRYTVFGAPTARPGPDGRFSLVGVYPGRYQLVIAPGIAKSAIVNGVDILDFGLAMTGDDIAGIAIALTDRLSSVAGVLTATSGVPVSDYSVIIAPTDRRYWVPNARRIQTTRPSVDGQYEFRNLPAGEYLLAVLTDIEPGQQFDPDFLQELSGASVRVRVGDRTDVAQHLRLGR